MEANGGRNVQRFARLCASLLCIFVAIPVWNIATDLFYYSNIHNIDWLRSSLFFTALVSIGFILVALLFIWKPINLAQRLMASGAIVILVALGVMFGATPSRTSFSFDFESREEIDLSAYEPFRNNTLAKSLGRRPSLSIQSDLPRLDGATALYPLYAAFARATYPEADYNVDSPISKIRCTRTSSAFDNLVEGTADIAFLMGISQEQRRQAARRGLDIILTPIGKEAFVFFVNKGNKISNISKENIIDIYSGQIHSWESLGGRDEVILTYQRAESSGSQVMLSEIMGDVPIQPLIPSMNFRSMLGMYLAVADENNLHALGYSFLYYIDDMISENKIKFLAIDGVKPTKSNISSGKYPFAHEFYAVTVERRQAAGAGDDAGANMSAEASADKERSENARKLIEWILSPQGQSLVKKTGYVPLP